MAAKRIYEEKQYYILINEAYGIEFVEAYEMSKSHHRIWRKRARPKLCAVKRGNYASVTARHRKYIIP